MEQLDAALKAVEADTETRMVCSRFWDSLLYIEVSFVWCHHNMEKRKLSVLTLEEEKSLCCTLKPWQFLNNP